MTKPSAFLSLLRDLSSLQAHLPADLVHKYILPCIAPERGDDARVSWEGSLLDPAGALGTFGPLSLSLAIVDDAVHARLMVPGAGILARSVFNGDLGACVSDVVRNVEAKISEFCVFVDAIQPYHDIWEGVTDSCDRAVTPLGDIAIDCDYGSSVYLFSEVFDTGPEGSISCRTASGAKSVATRMLMAMRKEIALADDARMKEGSPAP